MSMTDPIADYLTRIRNAMLVKHDQLEMPASNLKVELSQILKEQGYINDYERISEQPSDRLRLVLRYNDEGVPAIRRVQRVSRPGRRIYCRKNEIKPVLSGIGTQVVSTSQGLLTDSEARERGVGGEILCEIW